MSDQATIVDFVTASLRGLEASGRTVLSPNQQRLVDGVATKLDAELDEMVRELERAASCQQLAPKDGGGEPLPPFEAFCVGLQSIGDTLIPHLAKTFADYFNQDRAAYMPFAWVITVRIDAFAAYLLQIAQVHGLAFDETRTRMSKDEQIALANLGAYLRALMQRELDALIQD